MNYLEKDIRDARTEGYHADVMRNFESLLYDSWAIIVWAEASETIQYLYDRDFKELRELMGRINLKPGHHYYYEAYTYPDGHYSLDCKLTDAGKRYIARLDKKEVKDATKKEDQ